MCVSMRYHFPSLSKFHFSASEATLAGRDISGAFDELYFSLVNEGKRDYQEPFAEHERPDVASAGNGRKLWQFPYILPCHAL